MKKKTDQLVRVNFTNAGPGRIFKRGEYASGGEFITGEFVRQDAPASFIKSIMDKQVETMIDEVDTNQLVCLLLHLGGRLCPLLPTSWCRVVQRCLQFVHCPHSVSVVHLFLLG